MECRLKHSHVLLDVTGVGLGIVSMLMPASEVRSSRMFHNMGRSRMDTW